MQEPDINSVIVTIDDSNIRDVWRYSWQGNTKPPKFINRGGQSLTWGGIQTYAKVMFISAPGTQYKRLKNSW